MLASFMTDKLFFAFLILLCYQVSQVYQTIKIETLSKMISFFDIAVVEKISVDAIKHNFISIKVDHMKGAIFFGQQVSLVYLPSLIVSLVRHHCTNPQKQMESKISFILLFNLCFYTCFQNLESDSLRDHLAIFAESLSKARVMIYPPLKRAKKLGEVFSGLGETVEKEHKRLLARKSIIEKRKEEHERQLLEMV